MKMIKVYDYDHRDLYVNADEIVSVGTDRRGCALISCRDKRVIETQTKPEQVLKQLED